MRISGMDAAFNVLQTNSDQQGRIREAAIVLPRQAAQDNIQQKGSGAKEYPINEKVVSEAIDKMNRMFEDSSRRFEYSVHEKTHEIMIKVINDDTGEVIREIPPKKILDMVANMMEMAGLLVDERR